MLCELCQAEEALNFHHLIPRALHANKWFKRRYTRDEMRQGLHVCKGCHKAIHRHVPAEKELARKYANRDALAAHPQLARYIAWKRRRAR
jgi:hypothetical protein